MSLKVGEKEYSDKELVDMYRQQLKAYNDWCVEEAQKFFANKKTAKHYKMDVYFSESPDTLEIPLTEEELAEYTEFEKEERAAFEEESESKTEQDWIAWIYESYNNAHIMLDNQTELRYVDLHHPINVYRFEVKHFSYDKPKEMTDDVVEIALSDEQYISLVAKCMQEPDFTMAKLMESDLELYKLIVDRCIRGFRDKECAIFMTEAKKDANAILQSTGEDMPQRPSGFFAGIAHMLSKKQ